MHSVSETVKRTILPAAVALVILMLPISTYATSHGLRNPVIFPDIARFIEGALRALVTIALPVIAFFIVYAGFLFVKAQGKDGELARAKENFKWVILGAALILGSWVLATLLASTVSTLVNSPGR